MFSSVLMSLNLIRKMNLTKDPFVWTRFVYYHLMIKLTAQFKILNLTYPPINILILLTSRCNKDCSFCHYSDELNLPTARDDEMNFETYQRILDSKDVAPIGRICFYGGEPLLNKDLFKMIKYSKYKKYIVSISTNALLLEKYKQNILESQVDFLSITYYPEDIKKIKDVIKEVAKSIPINMSYMVSKNRIGRLEEVFMDCHDMGVALLSVECYLDNGKGDEEVIYLDSKELAMTREQLHKKYKNKFLIRWSNFPSKEPTIKKANCSYFWDTQIIDGKGKQLPCCHYPLTELTGSIFDKNEVFLNNKKILNLRNSIKTNKPNKICKVCHCLHKSSSSYRPN